MEREGDRTRPSFCQFRETGTEPEEVKTQLNTAGLPLATIVSLGDVVNAVDGHSIIMLKCMHARIRKWVGLVYMVCALNV